MAPRKNRPVLYEVMRRKHAGREPYWKRPTPAPDPRDAAAPASTVSADRAATEAPAATGGAATLSASLGAWRSVARHAAGVTRASSAWLSRGRVHLVLGWPELAFIALVLCAALYVSYQTGRAAGPAAPPTSSNLDSLLLTPEGGARASRDLPLPGQRATQPPSTPVSPVAGPASGSGISPPSGAAPAGTAPGRPGEAARTSEAGRDARSTASTEQPAPKPAAAERPAASTPPPPLARFSFDSDARYVIIQHFRQSDLAAAEKARDFLVSRGVDCVLVGGADIRLIATEPFRLTKDAAGRIHEKNLREMKKRITDLGKEYWYIGGYSFDKCYDRELK